MANIITKSMINNYVKQNVIEKPFKKRYKRFHVSYLIIISTLKRVLSISEISKIINKKFSFTNTFNIAVHAITLPVLLGAIYYVLNTFTGFYMKYFSIMYTSIATIYMMTSILLITSDNNENNNIQDD